MLLIFEEKTSQATSFDPLPPPSVLALSRFLPVHGVQPLCVEV